MNRLTNYNGGIPYYQQGQVVQQDLSQGLISAFVEWIDRSPQTTKTYLNNLRNFWAWMKMNGINRPTRANIIAYRDWLGSEHDAIHLDQDSPDGWAYRMDKSGNPVRIKCKAATVRGYMQSVKQFFQWTAANGLYPNVTEAVHSPKVRNIQEHARDNLEPNEILAIEESILKNAEERQKTAKTAKQARDWAEQDARLYAIYLLASNAGLRTVEISRACVKDLEVKKDQAGLYVWGKGKSEADTLKPLAPEVYEAIKNYLDLRQDQPTGSCPLFVSTGNRSGGKRIATTTISQMLKKAMQAAGFDSERITAHSLRHSAGTAAMEVSGDNLFMTQAYMRHADPATTEIYTHRDQKDIQAQMAKDIYNLYHGVNPNDSEVDQLEGTISKLTEDQVRQLNWIAKAMLTA